ncbi:hypothetical protein JTE90_027912 [Oedothorax gibbosus]|uniref:Uncharacterized protein n=1 Tax=Oedothorax gibbosus TaxID=931172 RepID=A0AAV6TGM0_9ARAC|nr:hypothetical protein JTE90_027912 [Oedothorax gibbosus]
MDSWRVQITLRAGNTIMNALLVFAMMVCFSLSTASPFKNCNEEGKGAKVISVDISGCDNNAERCELQRGSDVTVTSSSCRNV